MGEMSILETIDRLPYVPRVVLLVPALAMIAVVALGWCVLCLWVLRRDPETFRKIEGIR